MRQKRHSVILDTKKDRGEAEELIRRLMEELAEILTRIGG